MPAGLGYGKKQMKEMRSGGKTSAKRSKKSSGKKSKGGGKSGCVGVV